MNSACIYALRDPRTLEIRYVGCTVKPLSVRLTQHVSEAKRKPTDYYKLRWVRSLLADGCLPEIAELERVPDRTQMFEREIHWISKCRSMGCRLVNATDGGEGAPNLSDEARRKISAATSNVSEAERKRRRELMLGKVMPEDSRRKISESKRGHKLGPMSDEHKAKLSLAKRGNRHFLGHRHSDEARARCALAKIGNTARLGMPHTESTKAKIRAIRRERPLPTVKLSWDLAAEIRRRYTGARGEQTALGRMFGVNASTINEIVNNKIWVP